jgi:hypothetical protein
VHGDVGTQNEIVKNESALSRVGRKIEAFAVYPNSYLAKARKSRLNRLAGRLSIGSEAGKSDIIEVTTQKVLDMQLGVSLVERAQSAAVTASEEKGADLRSDTLVSHTGDAEHGNLRILGVHCQRSAERAMDSHGHSKDALEYRITTFGSEDESHSISFTVALDGRVTMTGPDGEKTKVHAGSETAERMLAELDAFPPLRLPTEQPF